jgi:hypothetical protein
VGVVSHLPADPWRGNGAFLDAITDGSLVVEQLADLLKSSESGVDGTLRAIGALSAEDLEAVAFAAAAETLNESNYRRTVERKRELARRTRWRRQSRFGRRRKR